LEVFFAQAVAALVASGSLFLFLWILRAASIHHSRFLPPLCPITAVFKHPHKAVVLQAFENFASYASYIPNEQALMTGILDAFVTLYDYSPERFQAQLCWQWYALTCSRFSLRQQRFEKSG
jgi:hypothetical protein